MTTTTIKLKDKYSGGFMVLVLRGGVVTGACGCEPARYIGLTESDARHVGRYGGLRAAKVQP